MDADQPYLRGGCSCGRNRYAILLPAQAVDQAEVIFSGHQDHRQLRDPVLCAQCASIILTTGTSYGLTCRACPGSSTDRMAACSPHMVPISDVLLLSR